MYIKVYYRQRKEVQTNLFKKQACNKFSNVTMKSRFRNAEGEKNMQDWFNNRLTLNQIKSSLKWLQKNSQVGEGEMPLALQSVYALHIIPFHHNYLKWYICISVMYGIHYIVLQWNYHTVAGTSAPCHVSFYSFLVNLILISAYMTRQMFSYTGASIVSAWKKLSDVARNDIFQANTLWASKYFFFHFGSAFSVQLAVSVIKINAYQWILS